MLVRVAYRQQNAAFPLHFVSSCDQPFINSFRQRFRHAQHFAGRFHFRAQLGIHIPQFLEAEYRHLNTDIIAFRIKPSSIAHIPQFFTQHAVSRQIYHWHTGHLADIRHRSGRTGIYLDDIDLIIINHILNIHQPNDLQLFCQTGGIVYNRVLNPFGKILGRIHRDRITGMNAGPLNMFHNPGDQIIFTVADGIHLCLDTHHVFVDQHWILQFVRSNDRHIFLYVFFPIGNDHILAA